MNHIFYKSILKTFLISISYFFSLYVSAVEDRSIIENNRQDQRINDLEKQLLNDSIMLHPQQKKIEKIALQDLIVSENPCFEIKQLKFIVNDALVSQDYDKFNFLFYLLNNDNLIVGQCIGTQSLQNIVRYAQNELIKHGYITTQMTVNPQDLSQGILTLNLSLGTIHRVISTDKTVSNQEIFAAFPVSEGDLLNLKQIDQGLENLKRVSGRDIDIKIEPAVLTQGDDQIGYSDLIISSRSYPKIAINLGVDDSGYKNTGHYIGSLGLSINNPLHLNDVFNINLSHSLDNWHKDKNQSYYLNYAVPFKNYELSTSFNEYTFEQNTPGYNGPPITYKGETRQTNLTLSRLISRSSNYKTSLYGKAYHKTTRNTFGGIDLISQRRTTTGWNLGIQHRQYWGTGILDLAMDYRRGTGALEAKSAPEENIYFDKIHLPVEGYARAPLWTADIRYNQPFTIYDHPIQYRLNWRGQYAPKILVGPDRFFIGGRYSVRGFDGEISLSGDNGHYLQQEFSWNSPIPATQLYAAIDQGWVNGRNSLPNNHYLMGGVFGTRSYFKGFYLDAFVGHGLVAPNTLKKEWVSGFNFNFSY
ncbi:ShlB/FhaC/HecB family hemolysin secretion/activation protein [Acinetobacter gerneri]|uniref:ShlB/FhaC/HecB family hemolysin secretion/activation protein n=1 Tax=Acinetobacter gerneri TaxID=202952 RepID=UPI0028B13CE0|nr:ShlB/FhaC/HecB family hemolysin secretion/activation protein [Acinetobacter gerneri]